MKFEKHTVGIYLRFGKKSQIDDKAEERKQIKNRKKKMKKTS